MMIEAPERIWLSSPDEVWFEDSEGRTEYTRSDITKRQIAELRAEYLNASKDAMELAGKLNAAETENARLRALPLKEVGPEVIPAGISGDIFDNDYARDVLHIQPIASLPLKDEVERVAEEIARKNGGYEVGTFGYRWLVEAISEAFLSRLRAGEQEGWKPIETAPKDGTRVLTFAPEIAGDLYPFTGRPHAAIIVNKWRGTSWWHSRQDQQPTHWQPLPAAPSEQGGDRG